MTSMTKLVYEKEKLDLWAKKKGLKVVDYGIAKDCRFEEIVFLTAYLLISLFVFIVLFKVI